MALDLTILYRGVLSSCNYDCGYCPFAKHQSSREELQTDRVDLQRFCRWVEERHGDRLRVFSTPWGEALIRPWYAQAITKLTRLNHVGKVAIQTNLSATVDWVRDCDVSRLGLWCTYHPGEVSLGRFLSRCEELEAMTAPYSVGVVGLREHFDEIRALRKAVPAHIYLWINAFKSVPDYYTADETALLAKIDPLFALNNRRHPSRGRRCHTGDSVISVNGDGDIRRCHFIDKVIGNLYESDLEKILTARSCTNHDCGCHIGYVHMPELGMDALFGDGILERIPLHFQRLASQVHRRPDGVAVAPTISSAASAPP